MARTQMYRFATPRQRSRTLAVIGIGAALSIALAACTGGSSSGSSPASGGGSDMMQAPATATGTLVVGTTAAPTSLDPANGTSGYDYEYLYSLYARLLTFDPKTLEPLPGLATKWSFSGPDNLIFHLTLQPELKFQDGTTLDAAAVKSSLEHDMKLGVDSSLTGAVKSIDVTGPTTLDILLSHQLSDLPSILADRAGMVTSPTAVAKYGSGFGSHPVGAGPYKLVSETPGVKVVLGAWSGYKAAGDPAAHVKTMTFQIASSDIALANEITSGQVQYAYHVSTTNLPILKRTSTLTTQIEPSLGLNVIEMNAALPPLNQPKVRLALEYAIDRQSLNDAVNGKGVGQPSWQLSGAGTSTFDPDLENAWPYNPDKAKQLLAQAGYPHGFNLTGIGVNLAPFTTNATIVAGQLQKIGVHLTWKTVPNAETTTDYNIKQQGQLNNTGWSGRPAAALSYYQLYDSHSSYVAGGAKAAIPGLDTAVEALTSTYTPAATKAAIAKADAIIKTQAPLIPLYSQPNVTVYAKSVHGETPNAQGKNDLNYLFVS